jgi:hypothetical protein
LNKSKIPAKEYIRVNVGDHIRFGASSRLYIFNGPVPDERISPENPNVLAEASWGFQDEAYEGDAWNGNKIYSSYYFM